MNGDIMDYRNIDEDAKLLHHVKRYYNEEINETQLRYILNEAHYSENEIDNALNDYKLIHIKPIVYIHYVMLIVILQIVILLLLAFFVK